MKEGAACCAGDFASASFSFTYDVHVTIVIQITAYDGSSSEGLITPKFFLDEAAGAIVA